MKTLKNNIIMSVSIVVFIFVMSTKINAQEENNQMNHPERHSSTEFGVRFMPTFSNFEMQTFADGTVKGESIMGYSFGAFVGHCFNRFMGFQAEVDYSSLSRKYTKAGFEQRVNLRYIDIPLLASFNTGKHRVINLNIVAGPQLGIGVGNTVYTSGGDGTVNAQPILSVRKSTIGVAYGAGLDFGLGHNRSFRLAIGYRGVAGLMNISKNSGTAGPDSYYILRETHITTNAVYVGFSIVL